MADSTTRASQDRNTAEKYQPLINKQVEKHLHLDEGLLTTGCIISNPQITDDTTSDIYNTIENIDILRKETKKLYAKYTDQSARIKKLELALETEQGQVNLLRNDNQSLRKVAVNMSLLSEQEEEYISNKLLKHITGLKKEKGDLLLQVEQEEEYLTNMLQKKLVQLQKEKIDLENALEQEQEYMVNRLQKQLDLLTRQQSPRSDISLPVSPAITGIGSSPSLGAKKWIQQDQNSSLVDILKAELNGLKVRASEMEREYFQKQQQCNKYKSELIQYRKENNQPLDDITTDDGRLPRVFRSIPPPSSSDKKRAPRSASNSSQRSIKNPSSTQLETYQLSPSITTLEHSYFASPHSSVLPQAIPGSGHQSGYSTHKSSPSVSSSSASSSFQRKSEMTSRRVSGSLFGLSSTPPQHPPQL